MDFLFYKKISQRTFSQQCGLSNGFVNSIVQSIQPKTMHRITTQYPDLNPAWILTGEGEMIRDAEALNEKITHKIGTPVYDVDATCADGSSLFAEERISGYIDLPAINKNAIIFTACGDSMKPIINSGDKIAVREIKDWNYLYYGQIYFIITEEYRMIKYVRKHPTNSELIIFRSENENYDDMELPKNQIKQLFVVENIISIQNLL